MAKVSQRKRGSSGRFVSSRGSAPIIVNTPAVAAPAPRRRAAKRRAPAKKKRRRSSSSGSRSAGFSSIVGSKPRTAIVLGSAALGFAHQMKWLEKLPAIGGAGPVTSFAVIGWAAEELAKVKLPPIVHDMITAGLAMSAFNIGATVNTPGGVKLIGEEQQYYPGGAAFYG